MTDDRCSAAHRDDSTSCEGLLDAVEVVDRTGGRVYPGTVEAAAAEVFNRAHGVRR